MMEQGQEIKLSEIIAHLVPRRKVQEETHIGKEITCSDVYIVNLMILKLCGFSPQSIYMDLLTQSVVISADVLAVNIREQL